MPIMPIILPSPYPGGSDVIVEHYSKQPSGHGICVPCTLENSINNLSLFYQVPAGYMTSRCEDLERENRRLMGHSDACVSSYSILRSGVRSVSTVPQILREFGYACPKIREVVNANTIVDDVQEMQDREGIILCIEECPHSRFIHSVIFYRKEDIYVLLDSLSPDFCCAYADWVYAFDMRVPALKRRDGRIFKIVYTISVKIQPFPIKN